MFHQAKQSLVWLATNHNNDKNTQYNKRNDDTTNSIDVVDSRKLHGSLSSSSSSSFLFQEIIWPLWVHLVAMEKTFKGSDNRKFATFLDFKTFRLVLESWRRFHQQLHSSESRTATSIPSPQQMLILVQQEYMNEEIFTYNSKNNMLLYEEIYNIILAAAATNRWDTSPQDMATWAQMVLDQMITKDEFPDPSIVTFGAVLQLWILALQDDSRHHPHDRRNKERQRLLVQKVQELEHLRKSFLSSSSSSSRTNRRLEAEVVYKSLLIQAYAKAHRPNECQALWEEWIHECRVGQPTKTTKSSQVMHSVVEPPNMQVATSVLQAWKYEPERAEAFLLQLERLSGNHTDSNNPQRHSYRDHQNNPIIALPVLKESPNIVTYTSVLDAWAKAAASSSSPSVQRNAPRKAEAMLRRLQELCKSPGRDDLKPNVYTYTTVLAAYANQQQQERQQQHRRLHHRPRGKNSDVPQKAGALLEEMIQEGIAPNTNTFNAFINCILSSGDPDRAWDVLRSMDRFREENRWDCAPDVVSYTLLLHQYAKRGDLDACEQLWMELTTRRKGSTIQPDIMAYNSMLHAYAQAGQPHKAEKLLKHLVNNYILQQTRKRAPSSESATDENTPKPQTASFNTVLSAWAKQGTTARAEDFLAWMKGLKGADLDFASTPNAITYVTLMNCWSKSSDREEVIISRVETLMEKLALSEGAKSNAFAYGTLLRCYARFGMAEKAIKVLEDHLPLAGIEPNQSIYNHVLQALAEHCVRHGHSLQLAQESRDDSSSVILDRMGSLLLEMIDKKIQPSAVTFSAILKAICTIGDPSERIERTKGVMKWMETSNVEPNDVLKRQLAALLS